MRSLDTIIAAAREQGCSDVHLTPGEAPRFRKVGRLETAGAVLEAEELEPLLRALLSAPQQACLRAGQDLDFAYALSDGRRQRVNIYRQRQQLCCAIRLLRKGVPTLDELRLPDVFKRLAMLPRGLILVTGPTGSGKSTTLAAMVDEINRQKPVHILTIEDPIEYEYESKRALIHQREIGADADSFAQALRSSLREDPDVILVGEMRDYETISAALTAAETGHLVLSTLHTSGTASTIDRIIDVFPPEGQHQVRAQLSAVLQGVFTQQLLPTIEGNDRVAALEILIGNDAVRNLIRENKCHQLGSLMQTGSREGMQTLQQGLGRLVAAHKISRETAYAACADRQEMQQYL